MHAAYTQLNTQLAPLPLAHGLQPSLSRLHRVYLSNGDNNILLQVSTAHAIARFKRSSIAFCDLATLVIGGRLAAVASKLYGFSHDALFAASDHRQNDQ
jgi:hypothetical protein